MKITAIRRVAALLLSVATLSFSQFALAHAHLKTPVPAENALVEHSPQTLALTFTEDVKPAFSGVELNQLVPVEKVKLNEVKGSTIS